MDALGVKNRAGYIVEAIRENYQDPELQKQRQARAEKAKEKELEDLTAEFRAKRNTLLRQVVHAPPRPRRSRRRKNPVSLRPRTA